MTKFPKDLVVLAADGTILETVKGLLNRFRSLGVREIKLEKNDCISHPERDSGCFLRSHEFLRSFTDQYAHALVMFDRIGCGREDLKRSELEELVENNLSKSGWKKRAITIVFDPELEIWVWSDSPHVGRCLGWAKGLDDLKSWLVEKNMWPPNSSKPTDPKKSMELTLREANKPRSSAIYKELAESVSLKKCEDPAFNKFRDTLQQWFPATE